MNNMGKVEKEVICPIKIISFDSNVSTPAEENNTMQLDVIKQLIKYTNTTDNVDVTFETVPISFDNTSFTNRSTASEQNIKSNKMKGSAFDSKYIKFETVPILFDNSSSTNRSTASEQNTGINEEMKEADSNNFDGLYSDLEYLDEFEPVVQTFIEKPASVSHLKNNTTMTNTFLKTNPDQSDTNFTDETSNDDDSTTEHLEQRLSQNDVAQLSYIDTVIKDLSEKYRKQRLLDGSVFKTKCDLFLYKVREADQAKVFPRQETTYLFKKINQTRTIARWTRRDYDHLGNVGEEVGNTEVLKRVEWDYCRKVLDKRKDEVVQLPSSDNGKRLATQYTVILNADTEAADGCLTVFDTRNNSLFHLKIEEAIENTNAVNITNLSSKDDGYL